MSGVDIFIKTYHKDFVWLEWCLKSIKKYATGFRNIIIVSDNDTHKIPDSFLEIIPLKVVYVDLPRTRPTYVEHGLGYLWQQYIKLTWYDYTDAEEVLILDSDEMLTVPTSPEHFKTDSKYHWFFRHWNEMGDARCWRESTENLLGVETEFSGMCITGFILQKQTSLALKNHLCSKNNVDSIWEIFVKNNMKTASEFNIYGCFIKYFDRQEYTQLLIDHKIKYINNTIKKDWSWGGLTNKQILDREKILEHDEKKS
jgi:hypothetical protein